MERRFSPVLLAALSFGIAVLYIPILVLMAYSFNASPLVNVWGGNAHLTWTNSAMRFGTPHTRSMIG